MCRTHQRQGTTGLLSTDVKVKTETQGTAVSQVVLKNQLTFSQTSEHLLLASSVKLVCVGRIVVLDSQTSIFHSQFAKPESYVCWCKNGYLT